MPTLAGTRKAYFDAFVLDEGKLRKLSNVLDTYAAKLSTPTSVQYRVIREDNSFYDTDDIALVLADDNTPGKTIRRLIISLRTIDDEELLTLSDDRPLAQIAFGARSERTFDAEPEIAFSVTEKDRDWCFLLADEIDTQIKRLTRRRLNKRFLQLIDYSLPFIICALIIGWVIGGQYSHAPLSDAQIAGMTLEQRTKTMLELLSARDQESLRAPFSVLAAMVLIFPAIILRPISSLARKLYLPVFYWGDMVIIHDRRMRTVANVKWGIMVAFVVSLLASIAYARLAG